MSSPFLSIIIPAYNEEARLPETLEQVLSFSQDQPYPVEILVVENGSLDRTYEIAQSFAEKHPQFKALRETMRGKGQAVRRGMLEAHGEYRFMCDSDLSMPIAEINRFLPPQMIGADIVIASREAAGAIRYHEPAYRHWGGRMINLMIRLMALPGLHDTQCGFKCFRSPVAEDLFSHQTIGGWSFDIELLFVARLRGYSIVELPIPWYFDPKSKLNVLRDSLQMGLDILTIRRNARRGVYNQERSPGVEKRP
ncbi:MAG: glycosyltransferase family 2 protein [Anaerolineales bacterium]|nr:glycosyltransferase family 2 protein [Anaerolineales bacterium]